MKKLITSFAAAFLALSAGATDYTGSLTVSVDGTAATPQTSTINVEQQSNGKYTLSIKDFNFAGIQVGDVVVPDIEGKNYSGAGITTIAANTKVTLNMFGELPLVLSGRFTDKELAAEIDIEVAALEQTVNVDFSTLTSQLPNSGFENFHQVTYGQKSQYKSQEANGWHSFMSATGSFSSVVATAVHTYQSDEVRSGAKGDSCIKVTSTVLDMSILGKYSANGTITTGRLNAGSMTADSKDNNTFADFSSTDKDVNGDPYYALLSTRADSISVWVKFHAGNGNKNPYASISALISNGGYVQDPQVDTYKGNIVAQAGKSNIASDDNWKRVSAPFVYATDDAPQGALVTISTCAVPSGGSVDKNDPDVIYVDDIALIYNADIVLATFKDNEISIDEATKTGKIETSGSYSASDLKVVTNGKDAKVNVEIKQEGGVDYYEVAVFSADLKTVNIYKFHVNGTPATAVENVDAAEATVLAIYNLNGQQVSNMTVPGIYIVKMSDGTANKVCVK